VGKVAQFVLFPVSIEVLVVSPTGTSGTPTNKSEGAGVNQRTGRDPRVLPDGSLPNSEGSFRVPSKRPGCVEKPLRSEGARDQGSPE